MKKKVALFNRTKCFFKLGIDDRSPETLFIDVKNEWLCGYGMIFLDLQTLDRIGKDFKDFFEKKTDYIYLKDTDSVDYFLSIKRDEYYYEIKGKIGDFVEQSLEFCIKFRIEDLSCDYSEILDIINRLFDDDDRAYYQKYLPK